MSKIGDLIVKLKLDGKDYKKGLKEAESKTKTLSGALGKVVNGIELKWFAVAGAIGAATKAISDLMKENQRMADDFGRTMSGMREAWNTFKDALIHADFSNLFSNLKEAARLGQIAYDTKDALGEVGAGRSVFLARRAGEITDLEVALRDPNRSKDERKQAGEQILGIYKEAEAQLTAALHADMDSTIDKYLKKMGFGNKVGTSAGRNMLIDFIEFMNSPGWGQLQSLNLGVANTMVSSGKKIVGADGKEIANPDFIRLAYQYNQHMNDAGLQELVKSITDYFEQQNAANSETKRIQQQINSLSSSTSGGGGGSNDKKSIQEVIDEFVGQAIFNSVFGPNSVIKDYYDEILKETNELYKEMYDGLDLNSKVDMTGVTEYVDNWEANVKRFQDIATEFRDACINGFADGAQYMADALFGLEELNGGQLLANLLTPLADMAIREGEILMAQGIGVEACKTALESLDGAPAIAAGAALIAIGATAKSGLQKLASKGSTSTGTTSYGNSSTVSEAIQTEMTVYVTGRLSGSDILIAGQRAQKALAR